jgi:cytochrome c2
MIWHGVAALLLLAGMSLIDGLTVATASWDQLSPAVTLTAGYIASAVLLRIVLAGQGGRRAAIIVFVTLGCYCIILILLLQTGTDPNRLFAVGTFAMALTLVLHFLSILTGRYRRFALVCLAIATFGLLALGLVGTQTQSSIGEAPTKEVNGRAATSSGAPDPARTLISTTFYNVLLTVHRGQILSDARWGGGIAPLGRDFLVLTGVGDLFVVNFFYTPDAQERMRVRPLAVRAPLNAAAFTSAVGGEFNPNEFRAFDVLVKQSGAEFSIFVSHQYWKPEQQCFVSRISRIRADLQSLLNGANDIHWDTVFETMPCLPIRLETNEFIYVWGSVGGGRMAWIDEDKILLTVGDFAFNGWHAWPAYAQDESSSYGKTILIDPEDGSHEIFTIGHRNPQGLLVDSAGSIWLTEHQAKGGDELNLLQKGSNYGWPLVTYGTEYESMEWPPSEDQGQHEGFQKPTFSWVPSIGISNLLQIQRDLFPAWKNDLLISSLKEKSLFRVRLEGDRALLVEPIFLGSRVRDLVEDEKGRIIFFFDAERAIGKLERVSDSDTPKALFFSSCAGCHGLDDVGKLTMGPNLKGVYQRRIGTAQNYSYSAALSKLSGVWSDDDLDAFLRDPQAFAPGTSMRAKVTDSESRAAIIEYLKRFE